MLADGMVKGQARWCTDKGCKVNGGENIPTNATAIGATVPLLLLNITVTYLCSGPDGCLTVPGRGARPGPERLTPGPSWRPRRQTG